MEKFTKVAPLGVRVVNRLSDKERCVRFAFVYLKRPKQNE